MVVLVEGGGRESEWLVGGATRFGRGVRTSLRESWDVGHGVEGVEGRDEGVVVWWVGVGIGFGAYKEG
ncbi:hypothetical protein O988_01058 [Pseudogymnoascus sp. VKM F-3808]|nr:hypothetical protein O988_01058 [Pseudogymnoascus sp. VKM F-3808]